jgi:hypothetical protein
MKADKMQIAQPWGGNKGKRVRPERYQGKTDCHGNVAVLAFAFSHRATKVRSVSCLLAWILHESLAATTDMGVLPGVLGCRLLRRTIQVRLGANTLRLPGGTPIFVVSRQQFM